MSLNAPARSALNAYYRSPLGMRAYPPAGPPPVTYVRIPATWDYVNNISNVVASDLCEDRNPPDPTQGPARPDLPNNGIIGPISRLTFYTQCFIRDFSPGYAFVIVAKPGDAGEFTLDYDLTANGLPFELFSPYNPSIHYVFKNTVQCRAILAASPTLAFSTGHGGPSGDYVGSGFNPGWGHIFNLEQYGVSLPTAFGEPVDILIPQQAPEAVTAIQTVGAQQVATAANHGLLCGSSVRIFDNADPVVEQTVRIHDVTTNDFRWYTSLYGSYTGAIPCQWEPAYDAVLSHLSC